MAKKNSFSLNSLHTWPMVMTLVATFLIIAIFIFLMKKSLVDDVVQKISTTDSQITKQKEEYTKNMKTIATLPKIEKEIVELKIVRDKAKKYLPTQVSMPSLIDNVYLSARNNAIVFDKFTPEKDIETTYYTIKPISLQTDVGYVSMSSFVEEVTTLERIMNVESVSFKANRRSGRDAEFPKNPNTPLSMTAQLRTYIFKDDEDDNKAKKK